MRFSAFYQGEDRSIRRNGANCMRYAHFRLPYRKSCPL